MLNAIFRPSFGYDTLMSHGYSFPDTKAPTLISGDIYITKKKSEHKYVCNVKLI